MGGKFGELISLSLWRKKVWQINRSANRLLIVSTNLDGFSLVNHRQFAKLSPHQTFLLYGIHVAINHFNVSSIYTGTTSLQANRQGTITIGFLHKLIAAMHNYNDICQEQLSCLLYL